MRWRTGLLILLGMMLPLPLVWMALMPLWGMRAAETNTQLIPMLSPEQRRSLLTYERSCEKPGDCQAPLTCFMETRSGIYFCTDSRCMKDQDCSKGFACRAFRSAENDSIVNRCSPLGVQREGEPCDLYPDTQQRGCAPGLFCEKGWCGRPCVLTDPASCPEHFFCGQGVNGPTCLPTCRGRSCPEGEQCVAFGERTSICAKLHGQDCEQTHCSSGQVCSTEGISDHADAVWRTCRTLCDKTRSTCSEGSVCHIFRCRQSCEPEGPDVCGPDRHCARRWPEDPWTCLPDL